MLREKRNDLFHLLNLLEAIGKIKKYIEGIDSADDFVNDKDQLIYNATLTLLANIGESISKVSDETQEELSGIDISAIRGMRNRIVHDYTGLDSFIVFDIAKNKLEQLCNSVELTVRKNLEQGKFDKSEFNVSVADHFYRHVRFKKINTANNRCNRPRCHLVVVRSCR